MTDQNTPELDAAAAPSVDGGEPTTTRPRRRRASRPAAPPEVVASDAAADTPVEAVSAEAAAEPSDEKAAADTPAADKPAKARRTRAKKVAAPDTADAAAPGTAEAAAPEKAAPEASDAASAEAPAKPARRRRAATRPVATPVPVDAALVDAPAETPVDAPVEDAETPAAAEKPARRRSRRATTAPEPVVEETSEEDEEEAAEQDADAATDEAPAEPASESAPETAAPLAPRLATTALLFQAPDLTAARPRRRRATSSAGSPEEISQAARHAAEAAPEAAPDDVDASALAESVEGVAGETGDDAQGERPSRRRGRRGRGARAEGGQDKPEEKTGSDETAEPVAADVEDATGDVTADADAATSSEETEDETAEGTSAQRRRRRRGGRGRRRSETTDRDDEAEGAEQASGDAEAADEPEGDEGDDEQGEGGSSRRRRRRRRGSRSGEGDGGAEPRRRGDEVTALRGSTRLEAKRQRRREGRDAGRRRQIITEAEFLARRESVERSMIVREKDGRTQIAVLEDGVLVEHYVSNQQQASMVGNVYLGRVQNVLPSMEAAFVDVGKGRNAVLYAGEVNWDAAGLEGQPRRIEQALKSGDSVLVQVTKDPIGHKGARLTSQVTLAGRYLVYVPGGGMTGISRKLPDTERNRLKKILREVVPDSAGVIVRTAAEGASEDELRADIARLQSQWEAIEKKSRTASAPALLQGEPDMAIRVVRDIFNDDFSSLVVQGDDAWSTISSYIDELAPDLAQKVSKYTGTGDVFSAHRIDEQLTKGMDRKVWLPSGGSLVIDRTEAMTVVDVNTGKFTGSGGTLEETVTRNNLEAAEEIVRQLRLRDIGGIIVIDFIDMVLESNRDLVLRRLVECLGRDRTKHQVAEVTSLGLVQMTRKRVGQGLVEAFSETCEHCHGRGFIVHDQPVEKNPRPDAGAPQPAATDEPKRSRRKRGGAKETAPAAAHAGVPVLPQERSAVKATLATIAAAAAHAHEHDHEHDHEHLGDAPAPEPAVTGVEATAAPVEPAAEPVTEPAAELVVDTVVESVAATSETVDVDAPEGGTGEPDKASGPELDVLAELSSLRKEHAPAERLELTPVDPSVFVTFDADEASQDEGAADDAG
ncbi:Rne/Rng family ribonuclease [Cellulomonas palmilytica]|uniref:Rne/Rng family ribonuclease n=1 Tax=Cellulomonas palmilytica TaxID=2608402 RepID=UPI001F31FECF|nr:Rne/Rng family ribonuclease [Cellulomonas palmilytica]